MPDTDVPDDRVLDPVGVFHGARIGRDPERTPMPWTGEPGAGFTDARCRAVAARSATSPRATSPTSATIPTRCSRSPATSSACATRCPSCGAARTARCRAPTTDVWAWLRGERTVVACNCSDDAVDVRRRRAPARSASRPIRARDDERVERIAAPRAVGSGDRLARRLALTIPASRNTASRPRWPLRPASERARQAGRSRCRPWSRRRRCAGVSPTMSARSALTAERVERAR